MSKSPNTLSEKKPKFEIIPGAGDDLNFKEEIAQLLYKEPFFAALSRAIPKTANYNIPTALVKVNPKSLRFELQYNPDFVGMLTPEQRRGVLKHEFYHLIFNHLTTRLVSGAEKNRRMMYTWNIATDLAINCFIKDELPDFVCVPGGTNFEKYKPFCTAEAYFAKLCADKDFQNELDRKEAQGDFDKSGNPQQGQGSPGGGAGDEFGQFDSHDWDENASAEDDMIAQKHLERALREAKDEAMHSGWGTVSSQVKKWIEEFLSSKTPWLWLLESSIKKTQRGRKRSTFKRLNRKLPYRLPGRSVKRMTKVFVAVDNSGSVNDQLLSNFFGEMNGLSKLASFDFGPFDTLMHPEAIFSWKKGEVRKPFREYNGGTDFNKSIFA